MKSQINKKFITLEEACAIVAKGGDVNILREVDGCGWGSTLCTTFRLWLEGCSFVVPAEGETDPAEEQTTEKNLGGAEKMVATVEAPAKRRGRKPAVELNKAEVLKMYEDGMRITEIAKKLRCADPRVRQIVAEKYADASGRLPRRGIQEMIPADIDTGKISALYTAGWSIPKIADEMGMEPIDISKVLEELEKKGGTKTNEVSEG